jgi:hypothetical protein
MERVKDIQETMLLWDDTSNRLVGITPDAEVRQGNRATSGLSSFELMGRSERLVVLNDKSLRKSMGHGIIGDAGVDTMRYAMCISCTIVLTTCRPSPVYS